VTLERDEGMPTWERFHAMCQMQFGPPTQGTRLAELTRLPFTSTVQEYVERYNAVLCHTDDDLGPRQKAKLFVGGFPENIQVDVEMRHPPDLQTTMYYARAFERRATAYQALAAPPRCGPRPSPRSNPPLPPPGPAVTLAGTLGGSAPAPATTPPRFWRLSPAEQQERRRKGLCFNCDEPYVRGHVCQSLFYLLNDDYMEDGEPAEVAAAAVFQPPAVAPPDPDPKTTAADAPQVSLHALAGVRTENAMVLHVTIKGHQLVALLDSGSMTNFISADLCAQLQLTMSPRSALRVLVANGDGVPCQGVTHNIPLSIDTEAFSISCFGITLGSFDLILGYDFLRMLGPILWDFARHRMTFTRGDHRVTWLGVGASAATEPRSNAPSFHSALRATSFEVVYGRPPQPILPYRAGSARTEAAATLLRGRDAILTEARQRLIQAQQLVRKYYDANRRELEFNVGAWVWLRLLHRTTQSLDPRAKHKL
jgi:hypothetical protein